MKKIHFYIPFVLLQVEYSPSFVLAGLGGSLRVDLVFVFLMDFVSSLLVSPARSFSRVAVFFRR
jgi:hypothetical protein